jgi:hypothetical protein
MHRLDNRRLAKARPILEVYLARFEETGRIATVFFEAELRKCWGVDYQALKSIMRDLPGFPRYRHLAAHYMETCSESGAPIEYQGVLAKLYGIASYRESPDREAKREAFWRTCPRITFFENCLACSIQGGVCPATAKHVANTQLHPQ